MLCIMDGFGWTPDETYGNAVAAANKPNLDKIFANYPMTTIQASGMAVGLPDGQMGNSEVGHTNMGAGRIVYQQLTLITKSIKDGEMFKNPVLVKNMKAAIDAGKAIHLMGLVGTGGVHSHADHWFGVLEMAKAAGLEKVYVHALLDGRDVPPSSGKDFVAGCEAKMSETGVGKIATVMGRYYAMDRDNRWERVEKAYADGIRRGCPGRQRCSSCGRFLRCRGHRRICCPHCSGQERHDWRQRLGGVLQLPSRPRAGDHPYLRGPGFHRL